MRHVCDVVLEDYRVCAGPHKRASHNPLRHGAPALRTTTRDEGLSAQKRRRNC